MYMYSVPNLPLCLSTWPHWPGEGGGPHLPANIFFTMDFCLCGAILKFEGVLFRSDSRHNDSLLECATKQAVMTVTQWHRNQIIRGLWLLAKQKLKMDSCLRGAILNLDTYRRM